MITINNSVNRELRLACLEPKWLRRSIYYTYMICIYKLMGFPPGPSPFRPPHSPPAKTAGPLPPLSALGPLPLRPSPAPTPGHLYWGRLGIDSVHQHHRSSSPPTIWSCIIIHDHPSSSIIITHHSSITSSIPRSICLYRFSCKMFFSIGLYVYLQMFSYIPCAY